ncbi:MAG TPA: ATP-binding protein [Acidimicrobiales bacterium]|jgi:ABC-type branched-subunit amino acid transport system ATPase component/sugar phosphate permease|nr:ATP-binding protein [Acidimicrobiales bacterium]
MTLSSGPGVDDLDPSALAAAMLVEEERRHETTRQQDETVVLGDDELLGVGGASMSLGQVLRVGGWFTVVVLVLLNLISELDGSAFAVLSPNIQKTFHLNDAALTAVNGLGAVAVFGGALPLGMLADRRFRPLLIGCTSALWGVFAMVSGLAASAWQFAAVRSMSGLGKGNGPVVSSLLSDRYPIKGRSRIFAFYNLASALGPSVGPVLAAGIATLAGGTEGWRWAFVVLGFPAIVLAVVSVFIPEPDRGGNEISGVVEDEVAQEFDGQLKTELEGETTTEAVAQSSPVPAPAAAEAISMSAAFDRLRKIKSFNALMCALGALGLAVSGAPVIYNVLLRDQYGLNALSRGYVLSLTSLGAIVGLVVGGPAADRLFRKNPASVLRLVAGMLAVFPFFYVASLYMPKIWMLVVIQLVAGAALAAPSAVIAAIVASIVPYRIRGFSFAIVGLYTIVVGGLIGGVVTGILADAVGGRTALSVVLPLACIGAAAYVAQASGHVRRDMSLVVEEIKEQLEENERVRNGTADDHFMQVRNLDFSYGPVQVLFDINLELAKGETLALLGTNGAGKSTLLRAISGLALPDRGVIRLNGQSITYLSPSDRVRQGVIQVPGGRATFPTMSVEENLLVGASTFIWDHERIEAKTEEVLELFPALRPLLGQSAGTLSGGEQQMLALAKALLLDPEILLIDELSLGLAPIVVQEILKVVERLKAAGTTMIIVEQSINVALTVADRAVFMEKGRIRFDGPTSVLLESGDLARAVFLGEDFT